MDAVAALLLAVNDVESERGLRNTGDLINKMPALVVKEGLTIRDQKLKITDLR